MTRSLSSTSLLFSGLRLLHRAMGWPARVIAARRLLGQVAGMSDYELRDIGLSRIDVSDASALPLGVDPGQLFQARVHERVAARSETARRQADFFASATGPGTRASRADGWRRRYPPARVVTLFTGARAGRV